MNNGSYTWKITNSQSIYKLMNASVGESFESDVFEIGKLKWIIIVYPNGWNKKNIGCFNVCIKLLTMSSKWRQLILCRTIECIETMSSCTSIASYYKNGDTMCWKERTLLLSELYQIEPSIKVITFKIWINILKIICKGKNKEILYPNIVDVKYEDYDYNKQQQSIQWKIDNERLNKFKLSYHSKSFESKKYHNKMWCLRCYPNGISQFDEGYIGLYLTLCGLPPNISKIKVLYTFRCKEFKNLKHSRIKNFSYEDKSSWGVSRFFEFLKLHKLRSLTIYVDITIMNEYDENGKEILPQLKYSHDSSGKYYNNTNDEDTEEEKVNNLDFDSINAVISSSMSSTLDNKYKPLNINNISIKNKQNQQQQELINMMKKEIKKEIEELQISYNIKLNSLCSIVEQIQLNNDKLSGQTTQMMKTVNDVCGLMQKERSKLRNNKNNDIEMIRSELESIKSFVLQNGQRPLVLNNNISNSNQTRYTNTTDDKLTDFEDERKDDSLNNIDSNNEVILWLKNEVKMEQYIDNFILNGFDDLNVIKEISIDELNIIGIKKLGHKMKILQYIRKLWKIENNENNKNNKNNKYLKHNIYPQNATIKNRQSISNKKQRSRSSEKHEKKISSQYKQHSLNMNGGKRKKNNNNKRNMSLNNMKSKQSKQSISNIMNHKIYSEIVLNESTSPNT